MEIRRVDDKSELEEFFRREPWLHLYELGDLDDFFWPYTAWHGLSEDETLLEIALVYTGGSLPVLLALSTQPERMRRLLRLILPTLPDRFYAHLSPGIRGELTAGHSIEPHGTHLKMRLSEPDRVLTIDTSAASRLSADDAEDLRALYQTSYPGNWFDPRMLISGQYFGIRRQGRLISVAGIHVYSERYGVAALGNITTLPQVRGQGLGKLVTAALCRSLLAIVPHIGLNVKEDNHVAIACYRRLGFEPVATYEEFMVTARP